MSDTTELPSTSKNIDDWNSSANFESPYSEKIQRLHALFDKARIDGNGNYFYVAIDKSDGLLPIIQWDLPPTTKDFQNLLNRKIPKQNYNVIVAMDLRETFDKQIRSTGISPEQPISWKWLRAQPINCLNKTLLLEHQKVYPKDVFNVSNHPATLELIDGTHIRFVVNTGDNIERTTERGALLPIPEHC